MPDYAVLYDPVTGNVDTMWLRETSDNISTFLTDGFIEVDGVKVAEGLDVALADGETGFIPAMVLVTDPTTAHIEAPPGVMEVDVLTSPTDVVDYGDGEGSGGGIGGRDPIWPHVD